MSETPDWLAVGAEVATLTRATHALPSVKTAVVTKIGKRDVMLDDGQRFNLQHGLTRHDGSTWSGWTTVLLRRDDPAVTKAVAEIRQARKVARARNACDDFLHRKAGVTAFDVILALAPLTGVAGEIAALERATTEETR